MKNYSLFEEEHMENSLVTIFHQDLMKQFKKLTDIIFVSD